MNDRKDYISAITHVVAVPFRASAVGLAGVSVATGWASEGLESISRRLDDRADEAADRLEEAADQTTEQAASTFESVQERKDPDEPEESGELVEPGGLVTPPFHDEHDQPFHDGDQQFQDGHDQPFHDAQVSPPVY
jgi:hypothetical protein